MKKIYPNIDRLVNNKESTMSMTTLVYDTSFLGKCSPQTGGELGDVERAILMASLGG